MATAIAHDWQQAGDDALVSGDTDLAAVCYLDGASLPETLDTASRRLIQLMRNREIPAPTLRRILNVTRHLIEEYPHEVLLRTVAAQAAMRQQLKEQAIDDITAACKIRLQEQHPHLLDRWEAAPRKPDFLIIGAMKAGTTALYCFLVQHPQIAGAVHKELWFFNDPTQWVGGTDWYEAHFPRLSAANGFRTGEATPFYLHTRGTAARVKRTVPDAKLIVLLRDPVERIVSDYHFNVGLGHERRDLETAITKDLRRAWWKPDRPGYASRSMYARQLREWFDWFPREQFLILEQRELRSDPNAAVQRVFRFLKVPDCGIADLSPRNEGNYTSIDPALQRRLSQFYRPHNRALERLLDHKFDWQ